MALDYTSDVLPHLVEGNAQATRDKINANMRHLRDSNIEDLRRLMINSGMVTWGGFDGIGGIIAMLYNGFSADGKAVANQFLTELVLNAPYPSSTPEGGLRIEQIIDIAQAQEANLRGGFTADSFAARMVEITGGRKYGAVTTQDVVDSFNAYNAKVAREQLIADYEAALGQHVDIHTMTRAEVVAGIQAAATQVEGA